MRFIFCWPSKFWKHVAQSLLEDHEHDDSDLSYSPDPDVWGPREDTVLRSLCLEPLEAAFSQPRPYFEQDQEQFNSGSGSAAGATGESAKTEAREWCMTLPLLIRYDWIQYYTIYDKPHDRMIKKIGENR